MGQIDIKKNRMNLKISKWFLFTGETLQNCLLWKKFIYILMLFNMVICLLVIGFLDNYVYLPSFNL